MRPSAVTGPSDRRAPPAWLECSVVRVFGKETAVGAWGEEDVGEGHEGSGTGSVEVDGGLTQRRVCFGLSPEALRPRVQDGTST